MSKKVRVGRRKAKKKEKACKTVWITPKVQQICIEDDISYPMVMQSNDSG